MSDQEEATPTTNAVSLFGQSGGVSDFPVLKAFQEYIDAEQTKARKRMFGLSIFFIVLLVVVVVTFTIVMTSVIGRNQALSDRLLDIALREKTSAQPVVTVQQPAPAPVVQPVIQPSVESAELVRLREELQREKEARQAEQTRRDKEKIESLTAALAKAQQQPPAPAPVVVTAPAPVVQPAAESVELIRLREELRREKEERKAEQEKAKEEKRKAEIEAHRRRLYPEYYAQEDARKNASRVPVAPAPKLKTMQPVSYFDSSVPDEDPELKELLKKNSPSQPAPKPVAKPAPQPVSKPVAKPAPQPVAKPVAKPAPQPVAKPVAKPAPKPVATKPAPAAPVQQPQPAVKTETLAIGGASDGGSIPWLIELPQN